MDEITVRRIEVKVRTFRDVPRSGHGSVFLAAASECRQHHAGRHRRDTSGSLHGTFTPWSFESPPGDPLRGRFIRFPMLRPFPGLYTGPIPPKSLFTSRPSSVTVVA